MRARRDPASIHALREERATNARIARGQPKPKIVTDYLKGSMCRAVMTLEQSGELSFGKWSPTYQKVNSVTANGWQTWHPAGEVYEGPLYDILVQESEYQRLLAKAAAWKEAQT